MYCPNTDLIARLQASVPAGEAVVVTTCRKIVLSSATTMESLVVVLPGEVTGDAVERLVLQTLSAGNSRGQHLCSRATFLAGRVLHLRLRRRRSREASTTRVLTVATIQERPRDGEPLPGQAA